MSSSQTLPLDAEQLAVIESLGAQGYYAAMYKYIADQMSAGLIQGYTEDQLFWFREAAAVNANEESNPAAFFIRDMTRLGMGLSSTSDPAIQKASNEIAQNVLAQIQQTSAIPSFNTQLNDDISVAINDSGLTIGEWGGSFYFWHADYVDPVTNIPTTVGQYILSHASEESAFVINVAQAIADTVKEFGPLLFDDSSVVQALKKGFSNFATGGVQAAEVGLDILDLAEVDLGEGPFSQLLQILDGGGTGNALYVSSGSASLMAGDGTDVLFGGATLGAVGNDTLVGGSGSDLFVFSLPTSGSASATIDDAGGNGDIALLANGQATVLGGAGSQPLAAVSGTPNTWEDSSGALYTYDSTTQDLTISGGDVGSGNQIVIDDFNIEGATGPSAESAGDLGIRLADQISLVSGATDGMDLPTSDFTAGSSQSYTVSVDAPSESVQTVTVALSGAPASDFGLISGSSVIPLNADGTFTVTIPEGQTSASFSLANIADVGGAASLQLVATIQDPSNPAADTISSTALTQNYVEPAHDPFGSPSSTNALYFERVDTTPGGIVYNVYDSWATGSSGSAGAVSNGNNYIEVLSTPNDNVEGGTGNDTIFAEFGAELSDGGFNVISGNGGQDAILAPEHTSTDGPEAVAIFANSQTDIGTAITNANTEPATGQQGDLLSSGSPDSTVVGGNGNDLIVSDGVIVAGSGDDTIAAGAPLVYITVDWDNTNDSYNPTDGVTWNASFANGQLSVGGGSVYLETTSEYAGQAAPPPAGYEGNLDDAGGVFGVADDTIYGGAGKDVILLSNGNDEVHLGVGDSTVLGGMGEDTIFGGSGNESVVGGGGNEYIAAGSGNDWIAGRAGDNTIFGGSGSDTIFAGGSDNNWATEETGNNYVQAGTGNTLIDGSGGNDTLIGGAGKDTIQAGDGNESVVAGSGDTSINGGNGADTLVAGGGADTVFGSTTSTTIYGGTGADQILGQGGTDVIYAGDGGTSQAATSVTAGSGDTTIYGGTGVDEIWGGSGNDVIYAGDGGTSGTATQIVAGTGDSTIYGGDGVDHIFGGSGTDVLYAGDGGADGSATYVTAGTGVATLYGGAGVSVLTDTLGGGDVLQAGSGTTNLIGVGQDTLIAGSGSDYLSGGPNSTYVFGSNTGVDEIANGSGAETLEFTSSVASTDLSLSAVLDGAGAGSLAIDEGDGSITVDGGLSGADISSVEFQGSGSMSLVQLVQQAASDGDVSASTVAGTQGNFIFDASTGNSISGSSGEDTISAWGNNDSLTAGSGGGEILAEGTNTLVTGGSGNDTLEASGAGSTLVGGTGNEVFQVNDASEVVEAQAGAASNDLISSVSYTLPTNVDVMTLTGTTALSATGNDDAGNLITGNSGNDTLTAGSGSDTLVSGSGVNTFFGGSGPDTFVVNNSADVVEPESYEGWQDSIQSSVSYTLTAPVATLQLTGSADLAAADNYGYATITGNAGNDTLTAGSGNDTLVAGTGVDTLIAGSGSTLFVIDNAADVIQVPGATGSDTVESSVSFSLAQGLDTLQLTGSADLQGSGNSDASNQITGNAGNDTLTAGSGKDTLIAGTGSDTLVAGSGTDVLEGGAGETTYTFDAGFGHAEIQPGSGSGTVQFGAGISASDLTLGLTTDSSGSPALLITDGTSSITIDGGLTGSIGSFGFADGTQLSLAQLLAEANVTSATLPGSSGNAVLDSSAAASLSGGYGDDTLVGTGASDTLVAGTGSQQLFGPGSGDVLTGGIGADTLYGGAGDDTLIGGTGNTVVYGGSGMDTIVLTQGGTLTFHPSGTSGAEIVELPNGMSLGDFTSFEGANGDLILQSLAGDTTAVIKGFYGPGASGKTWVIADSAGDAQLLGDWVNGQNQTSSDYSAQVGELQQAFSASLAATLNQIGQQGGSIQQPINQGSTTAPNYSYTFSGVAAKNESVQGGTIHLPTSENDQRTYTTEQTGTFTYTTTQPQYGEVTIPGQRLFISQNDPNLENELQAFSGQGVTPGVNSQGTPGYWVTLLPTTEYEQTGTTTQVHTVPQYTTYKQETQGFVNYNVVGDGGNDVITADGPFVGTVSTGNGNVLVNLGMTNGEDEFGQPAYYPGNGLAPGAFIAAGAGNDTIVGSGGADEIAAGAGFDDIESGLGSTVYVPLEGASTEDIYVEGPYYGGGPLPHSTLVLPNGVSPQDLQYRLITDLPSSSLPYPPNMPYVNDSGEALEITYGSSTVLVDFGFNGTPAMYLNSVPLDDVDGIDQFQFADGTVLSRAQVLAMAGPALSASTFNPVVTALNPDVAPNATIGGASLFSASDSSGSTISWYQISNSGDGGGHFLLNGVVQTPGQTFDVSSGQLSQLAYVAGSSGSVDAIQVAAFDGVVWGNPTSFNLTASSSLYQATAPDQEVTGGSTGPDTLIGGYAGDTLVGGSGLDTFDYNEGGGAEALAETAPVLSTSNNVLQFGPGITPSSISLSATGDPELVLSIGSSGDSVSIEGFDPLNPLASFPIQSFGFADGTHLTLLQLLSDGEVGGSSGSIANADGSITSYSFGPSGQHIYNAEDVNSADQLISRVAMGSDGSEATENYTYNPDGSYTEITVWTPPGGGSSTTTIDGYDASGNLVGEQIQNPDGSSSSQTWNAQGQTLSHDVTQADGSTSNSTDVWNADGSYTETTVATPAGGGASTTTIYGYDSSGNLVSEQIQNPDGSSSSQTWNAQGQTLSDDVTQADGSTSNSTDVWNADGSYTETTVATPGGGGASTTTIYGYDSSGNLVSEQIQNLDGSSSSQTWNAQGQTLSDDVTQADGSTSNSTDVWNADGSYTETTVATPAGGGASTTTIYGYDSSGNLVSEQIQNPDGSSSSQTWNAQGQTLSDDVTQADGSTSNSTDVWNADGSYTETTVATPAGGGASTTTIYGYDASGNPVSEQIQNPDGSSSTQTWNAQGQTLSHDVTQADGSTSNSTDVWNADGSYTETTVATPAGGGASTTTIYGYDASGNPVSEQIQNPDGSSSTQTWNAQGQTLSRDVTQADGSTSDSTYAWNADGSYTETTVATPTGGGSSTTTTDGYDASGNLVSANAFAPTSDGSYTDSWSQADGSHGSYWWNASNSTYEDTWYDSNGSSWTDEYQYASGGSPGASGYSFLETYTASDGSQGTRQYDASTGAITLSWDSASTGQLSGTTADSGFIGLQDQGELTNTQPDLTFFNPNVSESFNAFLAGH